VHLYDHATKTTQEDAGNRIIRKIIVKTTVIFLRFEARNKKQNNKNERREGKGLRTEDGGGGGRFPW
jgi:hypothetical protein